MEDESLHTTRRNAGDTEYGRLGEVVTLFLRLGFTAFGGPAAHIAMMREEVVKRRGWMSDERFVDLLGAVNLIPGPSSTQLAIYLGFVRAGWLGLLAAGVCFIVPAMLIVLALAWAYVTFHSAPQANWLLYGVKPVVIAIIAQALIGLSRTLLRSALPVAFAVGILALYLLGINELLLLFGGGALFGLTRLMQRRQRLGKIGGAAPLAMLGAFRAARQSFWMMTHVGAGDVAVAALTTTVPVTLPTLFLAFLKIGAVVYGSGYVILAFLRPEFVQHLGWLSDRQLLDAVSIGQLTPGPVFTTATFIGYIVSGWQGALVATVAIFLPSFFLVPIVFRVATLLRRSPWTAPLLDGVNVAAVALMAGVTAQLGRNALVDLVTVALAGASLFLLLRFRINSVWLILGGAAVGLLVKGI